MINLQKKRHLFHLVDPSPWPILCSIGAFTITFNAVLFFHEFDSGKLLLFSLNFLILNMSFWWRDVIRESTFLGHHTKIVQQGLRLGMILFIISEIMFFFSFFWSFFHSSLSPTVEIGCMCLHII